MWRSIFDNVIGTAHIEAGLPCQDACRVAELDGASGGKLLAIACSDGAGSAKLADLGSRLACDTAIDAVRASCAMLPITHLTRSDLDSWVTAVHERLVTEATMLDAAPRDLACTLLIAVVGEEVAVFGQVGDGAIVFRSEDEFTPVFWPQSGEYANSTNFVTQPDYLDRLEFDEHRGTVQDVAVFTDGLERLILRFADRTVHEPFLEPLFQQLRQATNADELFAPLRSFLSSGMINERTNDDKTLILASRL